LHLAALRCGTAGQFFGRRKQDKEADARQSLAPGMETSAMATSDRADQFDLSKTPESWCCVDCGVNTAPGHPDRKEMERLYIKSVAIKKLTGKEIPIAQLEYNDQCEVYDVRPSVWKVARIEPMGGCLCIGCLEQRLGRALRWRDFTSHPCNTMPGTERLLLRRKRLL
jgi:hypothetical protein